MDRLNEDAYYRHLKNIFGFLDKYNVKMDEMLTKKLYPLIAQRYDEKVKKEFANDLMQTKKSFECLGCNDIYDSLDSIKNTISSKVKLSTEACANVVNKMHSGICKAANFFTLLESCL